MLNEIDTGFFLQTESSGNPLVGAGIMAVIGIVLILASFWNFRRRTLIMNTPTSKIRSMAMGEVELKGRSVPTGGSITSPLSRTDCVAYQYKVEEWVRKTGKDSSGGEWRTKKNEKRVVPFFLDDGTGRVLIDTDRADLEIEKDNVVRTDRIDKGLLTRFWEWLKSLFGYEPKERYTEIDEDVLNSLRGRGKERHTESYIAVDEDTYVYGEAMRVGRRPEKSTLEKFSGLLSGFRDASGSAEEILKEQDVIISEDNDTSMFLVSDHSEKELVKSKLWISVVAALIGVGLLVGALALFLFS